MYIAWTKFRNAGLNYCDDKETNLMLYNSYYHMFTTKYVLFAYAIQTRVTFTYRGTVSRKPLIKPISFPWEKKP